MASASARMRMAFALRLNPKHFVYVFSKVYSQTRFGEAVVQGSYIVIKESITQITVLSVPMKLLIRNERDSHSTMKQDFILI